MRVKHLEYVQKAEGKQGQTERMFQLPFFLILALGSGKSYETEQIRSQHNKGNSRIKGKHQQQGEERK